jgi:hypothetical protein
MKLLAKHELERFTTVEFLPFGLGWTRVAETRFSGNKDLPDDNAAPSQQKVRNSTVVVSTESGNALVPLAGNADPTGRGGTPSAFRPATVKGWSE